MRKLVSIQKVVEVIPIPDADMIEEIVVGGWHTVAQKNEFKPGDLCVFFEIDAVLNPELEWVQKYADFMVHSHWRVRTVKKRKICCQGLALPLEILNDITTVVQDSDGVNIQMSGREMSWPENEEVSEFLGVVKYEVPEIASTAGMPRGNFPIALIPKTDELRLQSDMQLLDELKGLPYYISMKYDGTSATFLIDDEGEFTVCSRNLAMKDTEDSTYWKIAKQYNIEQALRASDGKFAIQGELCGPGIQKNPLGLNKPELYVFNLWNTETRKYASYEELKMFCALFGLNMVSVLDEGPEFNYTLEQLLELAQDKYMSGKDMEGIVVRPQIPVYSYTAQKSLSFKVLNNRRLAKEE